MNKKIILTALIIIFTLSFVALMRLSQNSDLSLTINATNSAVMKSNTTNTSIGMNTINTPKDVTSEFAQHTTSTDCWIIYQNKIYDITSFLPRHPGGVQKIAQFCGTTGFEEAFTQKHGTSKVSILMKVGVLIGDFDVKGTVA